MTPSIDSRKPAPDKTPGTPLTLVKFGQLMSVLLVLASVTLQLPLLIVVLWLIQAAALSLGPRGNLFYLIGRPMLVRKGEEGETQHAELLRFNTSIAVLLLCVSVASFLLGWTLAGYILAVVLGVAQLAALLGYCFGCFLYFQIKQARARRG